MGSAVTPRDFFNTYVRPALKDCEAEPDALHRAVSALCHIDALAEEVWNASHKRVGKRKFREQLRSRCAELGYAWDIHDIHKHGMLDKRAPMLSNGRRPEVVRTEGAFQSDAFSDAFQVDSTDVILTLHDKTQMRALAVIKKCIDWWDVELGKLGWP